jgi:hypothetical protein
MHCKTIATEAISTNSPYFIGVNRPPTRYRFL